MDIPYLLPGSIAFWSVKGGQGTTTVAATTAVLSSRKTKTVLVDYADDCCAVFGQPNFTAKDPVRVVNDGLSIACGLREMLDGRVVFDLGNLSEIPDHAELLNIARRAETSILVLRPCFLALRRANKFIGEHPDLKPDGIVLVEESNRALHVEDVEAAVGARVVARIPLDTEVSRAVDAGVLASCRLPHSVRDMFDIVMSEVAR